MDEIEIKANPDGSFSVVIRGVIDRATKLIAGGFTILGSLIGGAWGLLPVVRKRRQREALKADLIQYRRWLEQMLGVLDMGEAGPSIVELGEVIREALGQENYDLFYDESGFGGLNTDFLGRRLSRLVQILHAEDAWAIQKNWRP